MKFVRLVCAVIAVAPLSVFLLYWFMNPEYRIKFKEEKEPRIWVENVDREDAAALLRKIFNEVLSELQTTSISEEYHCPTGIVVFSNGFKDGRGLGNQLYNFAAGDSVARATGRRLAMSDSGNGKMSELERIFQLDDSILHVEEPDPNCVHVFREKAALMYDERIRNLISVPPEKVIILSHDYLQSYKYFNENSLKNRLKFRPEIKDMAERFLDENTPANWKGKRFIRVGVHVRRGDYLTPRNIEYGYTVPDKSYFQKSIQYMVDKFRPYPIQVIIASNDPEWVEKNIRADMFKGSVAVTISRNHSAGEDLAILSSCDHLIQSTGTFGQFAAYLLTWNRGNATIIYYSNFPRIGSELYSIYRKDDFFHPGWVGME